MISMMGEQSYFHRLRQRCGSELHQLQRNISVFLKDVSQFEQQVKDGSTSIAVYDDYIARMTDVIEMMQNCNLKLGMHCPLIYTSLNSNLNEYHDHDHENNSCRSPRAIMANDEETGLETEVACLKVDDDVQHSKIHFRKKDLSKYAPGTLLTLCITFVGHERGEESPLSFYGRDCQNPDEVEMPDVGDIIEYRQYPELPPENTVFGLLIQKSIIRATHFKKQALLLDFGNVVQLKDTNITYQLPEELQQAPAQIIPCQLEGIQDKKVPLELLEQRLTSLMSESVVFCVQRNTNDWLHVLLVEEAENEMKEKTPKNTNPFNNGVLNESASNSDLNASLVPLQRELVPAEYASNDFSAEELEMLYDEPICTSNALKAVLGYVPKDEKRICRFYNPNTKSCFKGVNCNLDHEPLEPDGWTKDVVPAPFALNNNNCSSYYFNNDTIINITVTYVEQLEWLYAQVNDPKVRMLPLIWTEESIPDFKRFKKLPHLYDLVLAKYEDGLWYRAKVLSITEDNCHVTVFFVDYGNFQTLQVDDLAECKRSLAELLYLAVRFRLVNHKAADISPKDRPAEIDALRNRVLNKTFDVEVFEQIGDDTFIRLFD